MSTQIDVLQHRFDAYQQAIATLAADNQTVAARKAAIVVRTEFISDMPLLIADALGSYRRCQKCSGADDGGSASRQAIDGAKHDHGAG